MAVFLRQSYNILPVRWGSDAAIQYAVQKNCEEIYGIDFKSLILTTPLWEKTGDALSNYGSYNIGSISGELKNGAAFLPQGGVRLDDANSQYIEFGTGTDYTPAHIGVFVKFIANEWTDADANKVHIVSKPYRGYLLRCEGGVPYFYILHSSTWHNAHGLSALESNRDYTLFGTYDRTAIKIYVDGSEVGSTNYTLSIYYASAQALRFGRDVLANGRFFDGIIKCVSLFDAIPRVEQIALFNDLPYGLYQKVLRPFYLVPTAPPVGWTGKINTITNPAKINGVAVADIASVMGVS